MEADLQNILHMLCSLPVMIHTDEELVEMSKLSLDDLKATAAKVSIEDAAERAGK